MLTQASVDARLLTTCRLTAKALSAGHRLFIQAENEADALACDEWLWTFKPETFVPHHRIGDGQFILAPVLIGLKTPPEADGILINLSQRQPQGLAQFQRILEIIGHDETSKQAGRQRWQFYKQQGFSLDKHTL
ncbi:DNA polymerase III subunit chi [Agitococcus lubricus]|uniref:DNA polymerase III subunit chi n=1 Tax=Agitococcus lubricus TaxID=1077255 RepID=UPI00147630F6|nr:DNA polymerase III subunit chi [Agitococcus lubricus]